MADDTLEDKKFIYKQHKPYGSSNTNAIPSTLSELLVKLKIFSMIERDKKINMSTMTFTDSSSWTGALKRSMSGEGRKGLMLHIKQIIEQCIAAIDEYQSTEFCAIIVNALAGARIGIHNLTVTYQSDPSMVAQLEVCISNIDLQLRKNHKLLELHYTPLPDYIESEHIDETE